MSLVCTVPKCENKHHARGLCQRHYSEYLERSDKDDFARHVAKRAWVAADSAERRLTGVLDRIAAIERRVTKNRYPRNCHYCGAPCLDVVCRAHADLLDTDALAPARNRSRA